MKRNTYASKMFKKMRQAMKRWQRQQEKRVKRLLFPDLPSYKNMREKAEERLSWIRYYYSLKRDGFPAPVKETCRRFRIHPKTFKYWLKRYDSSKGIKSLFDLSRRPKTIHFKVPALVEFLIILVRIIHLWGAERLSKEFSHRKIFTISHQGVHNIFLRYGLNNLKRLSKRKKPKRYQRLKKNELWHIDIKGPFYIRGVGRVYTIGIIDDYSRYLIQCALRTDQQMETVIRVLKNGIDLCDKPQELMSDNGLQFVSIMENVLNGFQELLKELGIKHLRCRVHSPETNGKIERFWQTLEKECFNRYYFTSLKEAQKKVDEFVEYYNYHRLNKAIGWKTPAELYWGIKNRDRGFEGIPEIEVLDRLAKRGSSKSLSSIPESREWKEIAKIVAIRRAA